MADDSPGELAHRLDRVEGRLDDVDKGQRAQDDRITKLAQESATGQAVTSLRGEMGLLEGELKADLRELKADLRRDADTADRRIDERFKGVDERFKALGDAARFTRTQWLTVWTIIGAILAAIIGAWISSRGIR